MTHNITFITMFFGAFLGYLAYDVTKYIVKKILNKGNKIK